jgi:predicted metal-dependent peptidase
VYCFDTVVHHVCDVSSLASSFKLIGGGGTSFHPIFNHIESYRSEHPHESPTILPIILTDGYASTNDLNFPDPNSPLLWVICPGGVDDPSYFPFGDVTRIMR